jgi:multidrug efflux pump subunit AcrA (membrane-fusion protein)
MFNEKAMKKKKRIWPWIIVILLIGAIIVVSVSLRSTQKRALSETKLTTYIVKRHDFANTVLATGAVKAQIGAEVRVGARISGKVTRLYANVGAVVKKGQVIAELDKSDLEAVVSQKQAELEIAQAKLSTITSLSPIEIQKAESEVQQWQTTAELDKKELNRQEKLLKEGIASQQALDLAKEKLNVSEAQLTSARHAYQIATVKYQEDKASSAVEIERASAALESARIQLSYATIDAPISGVIASVSTQEGETVAAGLNAPTFVTIIDLDRLQVDAYVDEVDIGKIKPGQVASFTVDTYPDREFQGKVEAVYPEAVIQDNVVNYDVVVKVDGVYSGMLRPEMTANVSIFAETKKDVVAIPIQALKRDSGKTFVYLEGSNGPEKQEVKTGWTDSQWIEILSGLREGQTVLIGVQ